MVRLAISVEGLTEERFIKMVMVPYLQKFSGVLTKF